MSFSVFLNFVLRCRPTVTPPAVLSVLTLLETSDVFLTIRSSYQNYRLRLKSLLCIRKISLPLPDVRGHQTIPDLDLNTKFSMPQPRTLLKTIFISINYRRPHLHRLSIVFTRKSRHSQIRRAATLSGSCARHLV